MLVASSVSRAAAVGAILVLAACVDSGPEGAASVTSAPSAGTALPGSETGSISGHVVDEELAPISGASVGDVTSGQQTFSDAAGRFTFNELDPGEHVIIVERLGFEQGSKRVLVVAGEVAEPSIALKAIALPVAWVQVDSWRIGSLQTYSVYLLVPQDVQTWSQSFILKDDPVDLADVYFEVAWVPTTPLGDGIRFWSGIGHAMSDQPLCSGIGFQPFLCRPTPQAVGQEWPCDFSDDKRSCRDGVLYRAGPARIGLGQVGVWYDEPIFVYASHFYRMPMPADYQARP